MGTHLAFLRAVNLGPTHPFPKTAMVAATEAAGFAAVATHLASGNVRFDTGMRSRARIEAALERAYFADRGFEVPTIVFRAAELAAVARDAHELGAARPGLARHYVYLLKDEPDAATIARIQGTGSDAGEMVVRGRAAHALLGPGYEAGVVDPLGAAKLLGVATNRTARVVQGLAERWC